MYLIMDYSIIRTGLFGLSYAGHVIFFSGRIGIEIKKYNLFYLMSLYLICTVIEILQITLRKILKKTKHRCHLGTKPPKLLEVCKQIRAYLEKETPLSYLYCFDIAA